MAKRPIVVGFVALSAALTGGAIPVETPAVAASAGDAVVTGHGGDHPGRRHHAGHRGRHRAGQRELARERQRELQHLLRNVTLVLTPGQKGGTDSRALPYDSQQTSATANPHNDQSALTRTKADPHSHQGLPPGRRDQISAAMRAYLQDLAAKNKFTGSVLAVRDGEVLVRFAAGEADEARHIPNRPGTVYRLASVTKQFTSMLVLKLRDRGLLELDDPICPYLVPEYISSCPADWEPITIREIVNHTSGIPDIQGFPDFYARLSEPTTTRRLIARFVDKPLDFPPGTSWKYSNSGYILAGAIIQSVTDDPYGTVLCDLITCPLGLEDTGYSRWYPPKGYAKGYFKVGSPAPPFVGSEAFSATGIYSTTDDLVTWDQAFGDFDVAPPATVKQAFTPQAPCPPKGCLNLPSSAYSFGWLDDRLQGHLLRYHPGLLPGYAASNMYLPHDDIQVVVLSNVEATDTNAIARHLATMALDL
ncbi:beta-lactamase family protein [Microbispora sp. RL4-1S]|uniref:Beta-lactamase family protein n=1 Tax=Microbispora oryzae TaxID=2806554 RepID=A0A940WCV5_9ACTN|nr:serine hydrolase domain-containing protein [Microbispora oryzae]MBP2702218.1 beta-lactamase family protein [Microbispora oryzae]